MLRQLFDRRLGLAAVPAIVVMLTSVPGAAPPSAAVGQGASASAIQFDAAVIDRDGKPVDGLVAANFNVTVDGKSRRVLWVRHVSRGPGASGEAASRQAGRTVDLTFAAEPARNVLVIMDELSIQRGAERTAVQAGAAFVDRLGLDDRVGVLRIPIGRDG